jgi:hypothetical protein
MGILVSEELKYQEVLVGEIEVDHYIPAGMDRWTRVQKVEHVGTCTLLYLDEDSILRDDMPLVLPSTSGWYRLVDDVVVVVG